MRPLVIGEKERMEIADLVAFARANPMDHAYMMRAMRGLEKPVGDDPRFHLTLPVGFRVVYSHELQKDGPAHHISISVDNPEKMPSTEAVNMILEAFGYKHQVGDSDLLVWIEDEVRAVNALEYL